MKILLITCLLSIFTGVSTNPNTKVYISTGNKAVAFHYKKTCRTIKRCNSEGHVREVSLQEAKDMGRRPCKVCCSTKR